MGEQIEYVITIEGRVDPTLVDWFGPVELTSQVDDQGRTVSTVSGRVADQSALVGLIRHLHGLGIVLLSIDCVAPRVPARRRME